MPAYGHHPTPPYGVPPQPAPPYGVPPQATPKRPRRWWPLAVGALAVVVAVAVVFVGWRVLDPGERPPEDTPLTTTVTPAGGELRLNDTVRLEFPAGAFSSDTVVTARSLDDPPSLPGDVTREEFQLLGRVYEIDLGGAELQQPATIVFTYGGLPLPAGVDLADLTVAQYRDGEWGVLHTTVPPGGTELRAETERFSLIGVLIGLGVVGIMGWGALSWVAGLKRSLTDTRYLEPDLVSTDGFTVDTDAGVLRLDKPLTVVDRGSGVRPKHASQMLAEASPTGMCIDFANLFGSLLIKKGYPVRVVSGNVTYGTGDTASSGGHLWVETVIDGKAYYVDTYAANREVTLVPLEEARTRFQLNPGTTFWKELEGGSYVTHKQKTYDATWFSGYVTSGSSGPCTPGTFGDCPITIK